MKQTAAAKEMAKSEAGMERYWSKKALAKLIKYTPCWPNNRKKSAPGMCIKIMRN